MGSGNAKSDCKADSAKVPASVADFWSEVCLCLSGRAVFGFRREVRNRVRV